MQHARRWWAAVILLCSVAAHGAEAQTPVGVVRELYDAYINEDRFHILAMLDANNRALEYPRREMEGEVWARCVAVDSLSITLLSATETEATVRTAAHIVLTPREHGRPSERVDIRTFTLQRQKDVWRIVRMPTEDEVVIERIIAAEPDDAAVHAILAENERLLSPFFVRKLVRYAQIVGYSHGVAAPDRRLVDLAVEIAATIGDRLGVAVAKTQVLYAEREGAPGPRRQALVPELEEQMAILEREGEPNEAHYAWWLRALLYMDADESSREGEAMLRRIVREIHSIEAVRSGAWGEIGLIEYIRHDYGAAYAALMNDIARAEERDHHDTAWDEMYLGRILEQQNDPELALQHQLRALEKSDILTTRAQVLLGAARTYRLLGDHKKAEQYVQQALTLTRPTRYKGLIARALAIEAELLVDRGELAQAETVLREALADARFITYDQGESEALVALGKIYMATRRYGEALRTSDELGAIAARREFGGFERYASLLLAGRARRARGETEAAKRAFEGAIEFVDAMRGAVAGSDRQRRLFFESHSAAYDELVDLLAREGSIAEALLVAEKGKGRALLDILHSGRHDAVDDLLSQTDRARRKELVHALSEKNRRLMEAQTAINAAPGALAERTAEVRRAQRELDDLETELAARYARLDVRRGETPIVSMRDLGALLPGSGAAFVEFATHERSTDVFVVDRGANGARVTHRRIDIGRAELERRVGRFADAVAGAALGYRSEARALYRRLLAPVEQQLRAKRVLAIAPDGVLWRLPFGALIAKDGRFLIERSALFFIPSISVYREMKRRGGGEGSELVAFGNPTVGEEVRAPLRALYRGVSLGALPDTEAEVRAIGRMYGERSSRIFTGAAASETRAKSEMPRARVIHLAAHGMLDDGNPMYSEIVLARAPGSDDDGVLQAWEMMQLDLHADLVVLSACSTARGTVGGGEGLIGMSWALFAAGCPSTVATLWNIDSPSAAELMIEFHRRLRTDRTSPFAKARALRAAQLRLIHGTKRRHPFYWSAFVLVGSGS